MLSSETSDTDAQPVEVFNYYAYGMMIPGFFSNSTPDYRFGFNSMLRVDDVRDEKIILLTMRL